MHATGSRCFHLKGNSSYSTGQTQTVPRPHAHLNFQYHHIPGEQKWAAAYTRGSVIQTQKLPSAESSSRILVPLPGFKTGSEGESLRTSMILFPTLYLSSKPSHQGTLIQTGPLPLPTFSHGVFQREQLKTKALFFLEVVTLWSTGK